MLKTIAMIGLGAALVVVPAAAIAEQGTSSSYGTVGWGRVIPTKSLTNRDRAWNHDNQARYSLKRAPNIFANTGRAYFPSSDRA